MALADVGDGSLDSGVFLEAKSFSSPTIQLKPVSSTGDSITQEGCGRASFFFIRNGNNNDSLKICYQIAGTATNGIDYTDMSGNHIADCITFLQGQDTVKLTIDAKADLILEPTETVTIILNQINSCDTIPLSATIYIKNVAPLQLNVTGDTLICSQTGQQSTITANASGGTGNYTYNWSPMLGSSNTYSVSPPQTTTYTVTLTDTCGTKTKVGAIRVKVQCPVEIPNVFTPNGDNNNDVFFIKNIDQHPDSKLIIYNRWGGKVYESNNYQNNWDGAKSSDGTYYYNLTLDDATSYKGTVTLLRN